MGNSMMDIRRKIAMNQPHIVTPASTEMVTFSTDMTIPLKELKINIEPKQDLHGYNHPWPAGGGNNQWDEEWESGMIDTTNGMPVVSSTRIRSKNYIPVLPSTTYFLHNGSGTNPAVFYYDSDKNFLRFGNVVANTTFSTGTNDGYIKFFLQSDYGTTYKNDIAINYPATITVYSPYSNECPISGQTKVNIIRVGKNLLDPQSMTGHYQNVTNGEYFVESLATYFTHWVNNNRIVPFNGKNGTTYIASVKIKCGTATNVGIGFRYTDGTFSTCASNQRSSSTEWFSSYAVSDPTKQVLGIGLAYGNNGSAYVKDIQIERDSEATDFENYQSKIIPISFPSEAGTVYGGSLTVDKDGTGQVIVDRKGVMLNDPDKWVAIEGVDTITFKYNTEFKDRKRYDNSYSGLMCSYMRVDSSHNNQSARWQGANSNTFGFATQGLPNLTIGAVKQAASNDEISICYTLATPQIYTLTTSQVTTLLGTNNIWADTGNIELSYWTHTS